MSDATAPEELPDLTKVAPADRDAVWAKSYYRGDGVPQLTLRAVFIGGAIGSLMSVANLYTTLKLGWSFGVAITACVISYAVWNGLLALRIARTPMTILENNCMQSTASAAGYSTGATLATAVGAMLLISGDAHRLGWLPVLVWVLLVGLLGVVLAVPMKRQMINMDQLPFPSGIAAAETLRSLYAKGAESVQKARALLAMLGVGVVLGLARGIPLVMRGGERVPLVPDSVPLAFRFFTVKGRAITGAQLYGAFLEPSLLLVAAGMITGLRVSASMFGAAVLNYFVMIPWAMSLPDFHPPHGLPGTFLGHVEVVLGDHGEITLVKLTRWSLWIGTSLMVASGLTSFAFSWRTVVRAFTSLGKRKASDGDDPLAGLEVPAKWTLGALVPITIGLVALCWLSFRIAPWLALVSVALSFLISLVACRATGETDTTPVGPMGKVTQLIYAVLSPHNISVNLLSAGITSGAASSSADLLTDLKSGYLLGANPRKQFIAQFVGVFIGAAFVVPAWYLLVPTRARLEAFHSPATTMWHAVAVALTQGLDSLPPSAKLGIGIGVACGVVLGLLDALLPAKAKRFLPSAMGIGLALVLPFANSAAFFVGAVIATVWQKARPISAERFVVPLASGVIAGESLASAAAAIYVNVQGMLH